MTTKALALHDVRVFDGDRLSAPRTVVIDGAVIGTDASRARSIETGGATLLPGLIDAHVHLRQTDDLGELARWGVTTALDMGCWPLERVSRLRAATSGFTDFRTAGLPAIGPGGLHARMPGMPDEAIVLTEEDARRHVAARVAEGVDYVKVVAEAPGEGGPSCAVVAAVVAAAREHGLATVVHAASVGAYAVAVESGARFVTHMPVMGRIRAGDVAVLAAGDRVVVPTAVMMAGVIAGGRSGDRGTVEDALASVAAMHAAGVPILAGTDANAAPGAPGAIRHGESLHDELALLTRAGMSASEVLRAATSLPARAFGLRDRGRIEPGMRADLVLLEGDPTTDIAASRTIRAVWCAGRLVPDPRGGVSATGAIPLSEATDEAPRNDHG